MLTGIPKRSFVCVISNTLMLKTLKENPCRMHFSDMERENRGMNNANWLCDPRHTTCDLSSGVGSILVYWPFQRWAVGADKFVHLT